MYWTMSRALANRNPTPRTSRTLFRTLRLFTTRSYPLSNLLDRRQRRIEAVAAPRFVETASADQHAVAARDEPLRVIRGIAADDANRQRLRDVFRDREELRHRLERPAQIILIEPRDDDPFAAIRQRVADRRQSHVEELAFVDADDFGVVVHQAQQLVGAAHRSR